MQYIATKDANACINNNKVIALKKGERVFEKDMKHSDVLFLIASGLIEPKADDDKLEALKNKPNHKAITAPQNKSIKKAEQNK